MRQVNMPRALLERAVPPPCAVRACCSCCGSRLDKPEGRGFAPFAPFYMPRGALALSSAPALLTCHASPPFRPCLPTPDPCPRCLPPLQRGALEEALSLARLHAPGPHFMRSLEWLLFTTLEMEPAAPKGPPTPSGGGAREGAAGAGGSKAAGAGAGGGGRNSLSGAVLGRTPPGESLLGKGQGRSAAGSGAGSMLVMQPVSGGGACRQ